MLSHLSKTKLLQSIRAKRKPSSRKTFFIKPADLPGGGYGTYIKLDKSTGIKIAHEGFSSKKKLLKSRVWKRFKKEYETLKKARTILGNTVPKAKMMFPILVELKDTRYDVNTQTYCTFTKKEWRSAFAMQHIEGSTLSSSDLNYIDKQSIFTEVESTLSSANICHVDLHYHNIMVRNKVSKNQTKFVIIDWDSQFIEWRKR
jgi:RIO-like serine/threonine protein kinase